VYGLAYLVGAAMTKKNGFIRMPPAQDLSFVVLHITLLKKPKISLRTINFFSIFLNGRTDLPHLKSKKLTQSCIIMTSVVNVVNDICVLAG
jgi:hypothetical protein